MSVRSGAGSRARWLPAAILCITIPLVSGCLGSGNEDSDAKSRDEGGFISQREWELEYHRTVESFLEKLPLGFQFAENPTPPEGQIAASLGVAEAYFQWYCAWLEIYVEDPGEGSQREALEQLRRFQHTEWGREHVDDPDGVWDKTLDAAELGDRSGVKEFYETDCGLGGE